MDQINVLKNDRHELNNTISDLKEQLRAAKAAGLHAQHAGGKMDADLKQYITGLIREIDKSLKNWED